MKVPKGAAGARVLGVGAYLPAREVPNSELVDALESTDAWIRSRSGIRTRRFAADDETVVDMAVAAGAKAIADAGSDPRDVDLVLIATCTHPYQLPGAAAEVASRLGATAAGAVDVNAACAGFSYALAHANDAIRAGSARLVVVVGAERFTSILDLADRGTAFLFGDGAGAVVVGPSDEPGIGPAAWGSDGTQRHLIAQLDMEPRSQVGLPFVRMEGPAVYRWAVTEMAAVGRRACELAGVDPDQLAAFVPHQANVRIIRSIAKNLGLSDECVVAEDVVDVGNTSAASIPLALARLAESHRVPSGSPVLLLGFGAGLTYAGQVVLMP